MKLVKVLQVIFYLIIGIEIFYAGSIAGRSWEREDNRRIDCEVKFNRVAQKDISGECLKYFIKK